MSSIRKFLIINTIIILSITTIVTSVWNYIRILSEIEGILDMQLVVDAKLINILFSDNISDKSLASIESKLEANYQQPPKKKELINKSEENSNFMTASMEENFFSARYKTFHTRHIFQVWRNGKLLLRSHFAPITESLASFKPGYEETNVNKNAWKTYTLYNPKNKLVIQTGQMENIRYELATQIAREHLVPVLIMYPILGFLLWVSIGFALKLIKNVTNEIHNRSLNNLQPLKILHVPEEIKPLVDELNRLFNKLNAAFEREKRFTADAAHELRTPLAAIKTQTQVACLELKDNDPQQNALIKVIAGVDRCSHVVEQLLVLSKLEPDKGLKEIYACNLIKITKETISLVNKYADEKNIVIKFHAPHMVSTIYGNSTFISILCRNIIDNAVRYSKENTIINVYIKENKPMKYIEFCVIDNGPGIKETDRERIFERFYRELGNSAPGSGLGLSIVKQIADLHKAKIILDNPVSHKGLKFSVYFKVDDSEF